MKQEKQIYRWEIRTILIAGICILIVFILSCLGGCGVNELENQAFPLALGVETEDAHGYRLYLAYPNLQDEKASENALSSDVYWEQTVPDLAVGMHRMSESSNKNPDLNHLKVLILQPQIFAEKETMESVLAFFEKETEAAWNTYVLMTEEPLEKLFSEENQLPECMGIYLEDMLEEWEHVKKQAFVTVGTLMRQFYGTPGVAYIPKLVVEQGKISIGGFAILNRLQIVGNLSLEDGEKALLLQNKVKGYQFQMQDGTGITLEQLRVKRRVTREMDEEGTMYPVMKITVHGQIETTNRVEKAGEKSDWKKKAEDELQEQLQQLVTDWQKAGCDLTDSYPLLAGNDRELWKLYQKDQTGYTSDLRYRMDVDLQM